MFYRNRWFKRGRIYSDEGFWVACGRDKIIYCEAGRKMTVTTDWSWINVYTVNRWDDDPMNAVDASTQARIVDNIRRAMEWAGYKPELRP
jgi:hypothetical protein